MSHEAPKNKEELFKQAKADAKAKAEEFGAKKPASPAASSEDLAPGEEQERKAELLTSEEKKFLRLFLSDCDINKDSFEQLFVLVSSEPNLKDFFSKLHNKNIDSSKEAGTAIRKLLSEFHPDRNNDAEAKGITQILNKVRKFLKNEDNFARLDLYRQSAESSKKGEGNAAEEAERSAKVEATGTFDELYAVLRSFVVIKSKSYPDGLSADVWIKSMERNRHDMKAALEKLTFDEAREVLDGWRILANEENLTGMPRIYGIRAKADRLLVDELEAWMQSDTSRRDAQNAAGLDKLKKTRTEQVNDIKIKSFEELYQVLERFKEIPLSNGKKASYEDVKERIEMERASIDGLVDEYIKSGKKKRPAVSSKTPRVYDIRDKVEVFLNALFEKTLAIKEAEAKEAEEGEKKSKGKEDPAVVERNEKLVKEAQSLTELFGVLGKIGKIPTGVGTDIPAESVIKTIGADYEYAKGIRETWGKKDFADWIASYAALVPEAYGIKERAEKLMRKQFREKESVEPQAEAAPVPKTADKKPPETLYSKIDKLTHEVNELRAKWVEEDVKKTTAWKKLKSLFGISKDKEKGEWQKLYEEKAWELQQAEVAMMQGDMAGAGTQLREGDKQEGARRLLRYYKLDEAVNLITERTQYRAEHENFSDKVIDSLTTLGRQYNSIPLKRKLTYAAIFIGLGIAATASGGAAAGAMASLIIARRSAASLGTAVGVEAGLEKFGDWRRTSEANKGVEKGMASGFDAKKLLYAIGAETFSLDAKLQEEKRAKTWRKLTAVGVGALVGSGWLSQMAMQHLGGDELAHWAKEHAVGLFSKESVPGVGHSPLVIKPISRGDIIGGPDSAHGGVPEVASEIKPPVGPDSAHGGVPEVAPGVEQAATPSAETSSIAAPLAAEQVPIPSGPLLDGSIAKFEDILSDPYQVKSGDTVWKILGSRVEGLDGPQKTYFIDTLKVKLADLSPDQLREMGIKSGDINTIAITDKIDFSEHLTAEDIQQSFTEAQGLSPEKIASIEGNNSFEKVPGASGAKPSVIIDVMESDNAESAQGGMDALQSTESASSPINETPSDNVHTTIDVEELNDVPSAPETAFDPKLQPRVNDWYMQIFRTENAAFGQDWILDKEKLLKVPIMEVYKDFVNHTSLSGLNSEQIKSFAQFMAEAKKATGEENLMREILRANPDATAEVFLKKVAPLIQEGQRLGLYTTTR